ncbi:energy-coupling factor ABC transporter ATP-binding protein [Mycetocola spongiae]|nr:energy-coupling factor ABC transporter ATP-binding protein [Mycetocola spongiae]
MARLSARLRPHPRRPVSEPDRAIPALRLSDVSVTLGGHEALAGVSLALDQTRIGVIGLNGSGKSTFARLLNGLATATSGSVSVLGLDPAREAREVRRAVGFIFSNPDAQIIAPTVAEDIAFSLRGRGLSRAEIARRVAQALPRFGLDARADAPAHDLSGGQKQLLALCSVLIGGPRLVVADEPTALLDAVNRRVVSDHLFSAAVPRLVLVTHDMRLAARCEVVLRFENGRLHESGEPAAVIARYESDHA